MFKKEKFSVPFFVISSLAVLLFLFVFVFIMRLYWLQTSLSSEMATMDGQVDKIYLNESYKDVKDPLLTKKPDLKDMLAGPIISKNDPFLGNNGAQVSLVIFSDYQCDVCYNQETVFKKIIDKYQGRVKLIWKDYPENNSNSISFQASMAGRCANEQNKFWEYHNLLFENKDQLSSGKFIELAKNLKLNEVKFEKCLTSGTYKQQIIDNLLEANALEINGVPFIYVNNQEVMGEISFEDLEEMIEGELMK